MDEIEKTYLVKFLPEGLLDCEHKEIYDIYLPKESPHPGLRIRKNGDQYEITKKRLVNQNDASHRIEETIKLSEAEFLALEKIDGKKVRKIRYFYEFDGNMGEIDVFLDNLAGLILADFEFKGVDIKDAHLMPPFCLADVTQSSFTAGGL